MGGFCTTTVDPLPDYSEVITDTQLPGWVSEGGKRLFEEASSLARGPYPAYEDARIASYTDPVTGETSKLSPDELAAQQLLRDSASGYQSYINSAKTMADKLGQGFQGMTSSELIGDPYSGASREELLGGTLPTYQGASRADLIGSSLPAYQGASREDLLGNYTGATRDQLVGESMSPFTMETAQPFLDIYQGAQDASVSELERQTARANARNRASAARSGAFGGSRLGIQEALTQSEGARGAADLRAQAAAQGLQFAAGRYDQDRAQSERDRQARFGAENLLRGQFMQDREGRFTAENLMRSQYEQDRAQAERDRSARFGAEDVLRGRFEQDRAQAERDRSARFGAEDVMRSRYDAERQARFGAQDAARSAFETEEASRLRATEALQGFAPLTQALSDQAAAGLFTSGQAQRELDQRALDMAYADYVEQRQYPYDQINYALGVLQGTPYDTRNISLTQGQQFIQSPSIYGQTIGGLGALGSAYFMSKNRGSQ
jgi:hypothetical protein